MASGVLLVALSFAPFQCAREPDPNRRMEDDPAKVVYELAERFKATGKGEAHAATLKYLVEKFPSSRYAKRAQAELQDMGQAPPSP